MRGLLQSLRVRRRGQRARQDEEGHESVSGDGSRSVPPLWRRLAGSVSQPATRSRRSGRRPGAARNLAAPGGDSQFDELVGHIRFEPFGVTFLQAQDIRHDPAVLAVWILIHLGATGTRIVAPAVGARILTRRIPYIALLRVDHFGTFHALAANEFVGQGRSFSGNRFVLAIGEDERVVACAPRRTRGGRSRRATSWA